MTYNTVLFGFKKSKNSKALKICLSAIFVVYAMMANNEVTFAPSFLLVLLNWPPRWNNQKPVLIIRCSSVSSYKCLMQIGNIGSVIYDPRTFNRLIKKIKILYIHRCRSENPTRVITHAFDKDTEMSLNMHVHFLFASSILILKSDLNSASRIALLSITFYFDVFQMCRLEYIEVYLMPQSQASWHRKALSSRRVNLLIHINSFYFVL